jgi:hypothetical protein
LAFKLTIKQQNFIIFLVIVLNIKFWKILVRLRVTITEPYGVTGVVLDIKGEQSVSFMLEGREFKHPFLICSFPTDTADLVGTDFMTSLGAVIDLDCGVLTSKCKVPRGYIVPPTGHMALTIFSDGKECRSPRRRKRENRRKYEQILASPRLEIAKQEHVLARQGYRERHGRTQVSASSIRKAGV